jgi:hypothetical protein
MIFAFLVVLLAVLTYVGFKQSGDRGKQLAAANQELANARNALHGAQDEANRFKEFMGFPIEDNLATVEKVFQEHMQTYAANFPEEKRAYGPVLEYLHNEMRSIGAREAAAIDRAQALKDDLSKVQADASKQVAQYQHQMEELERTTQAQRTGFEKDRESMKEREEKYAEQVQKRDEQITALTQQNEEQKNQLETKINQQDQQIFRLSQELKKLKEDTFEVADGAIASVNQASQVAFINLGRDDGLFPRVTFSVYDAGENNATTAAKKGSIEVTRILGPHLAEATITRDTVANPITSGDPIYSPIWHRGRSESFALAGMFDVDGDGKNDLELLRNLIKVSGGILDAEIGDDGKISGAMSVNTRYLVQGEEPNVTFSEGQDSTAVQSAAEIYSKMISDAGNLGVKIISLEEFLDRVGWQPDQRTVPLGRSANPDDFPAEPEARNDSNTPRTRSTQFRKRPTPRPDD